MNKNIKLAVMAAIAGSSMLLATSASASCAAVSRADFISAAKQAVIDTSLFGFRFPMWLTMVNENGKVCHVYATDGTNDITGGVAGNSAWLGSRVISAQKANTANAFSLDGFAISTGFITVATYENGSLFGLQHSNPVDASIAYLGSPADYGTAADPLTTKRPGGVNVFGGGVALYNSEGLKVGAIGASGDTSCRDHAVAYRMRLTLGLNNQPNDDGLKLVAAPAALGEQPACGVDDPTAHAWDNSTADFGIRP